MARSLEDRLNQEFAPGWRPDAGEQLVGTIVEISSGRGDYGEYPLLVVEKADGTGDVAVHAFHTVLKSELAAKRPSEGDRIGIKYLGIPAGKKYESYRVVLERKTPATGTDWNQVGQQASDEMHAADRPAPASTPAAAADDAFFGEEPF